MIHRKLFFAILAGALYFLALASGPLGQTGLLLQGLIFLMLGCAAFCAGLVFSENSTNSGDSQEGESQIQPVGVRPPDSTHGSDTRNTQAMKEILTGLSVMHHSQDLYERYQCFIQVIENGFNEVFGPCNVTLWCPDKSNDKLVECVIQPNISLRNASGEFVDPHMRDRQACEIPLDIDIVKKALATKQPSLVTDVIKQYQSPGLQPKFDVCIPLFREFGQPVLVMARRINNAGMPFNTEIFLEWVEIIRHFWQQLQATNQRQWRVEHSELDGVLRDQFFLERAESLVTDWSQKNELFSLCVISIGGFRQTLGGQADLWRQTTGLFGRSLDESLINRKEEFLLGRMADDVFVVLLPRKDRYIAQVCIEQVLDGLGQRIATRCQSERIDNRVMELQWSLADHTDYRDSVATLLSEVYKGLFETGESDHAIFHRLLADNLCDEVSL
jgi:GGDEF domain-containing protein